LVNAVSYRFIVSKKTTVILLLHDWLLTGPGGPCIDGRTVADRY
jgi:hypothetical protein